MRVKNSTEIKMQIWVKYKYDCIFYDREIKEVKVQCRIDK